MNVQDLKPSAFIKGIFETHLNVANLDRSVQFYEQMLGLQLGTRDDRRGLAIYWVGGWGHTLLGLWEKPDDQIFRQHFAFEVDLESFRYAIQSSYDWFATEKVGQPANATPFGIQPRLNR